MKKTDTLKDGGVKCGACGKLYKYKEQWNGLRLIEHVEIEKEAPSIGYRQYRECLCGKPVVQTVAVLD